MTSIPSRIAQLLSVRVEQIDAAISLLDQGDTVPFISRYRKEVTGGLDDSQMRQLEDRLRYFRELEDRRASILSSINEQGKLTAELQTLIDAAETKTALEDLYLPYKKKRRTKGQIAIEAGLDKLVEEILSRSGALNELAARYTCEEFPDAKSCLDGAKFILMERWAELPELVGSARSLIAKQAHIVSKVMPGKETEGAKYRDYFDHHEACSKVPSHRALAMLRGRNEGILGLSVTLPELIDAPMGTEHPVEAMIHRQCELDIDRSEHGTWLKEVARWCWKIKLSPHIDTDIFNQMRQRAEDDAIQVFSANLRDLLLAAPAGARATIGLDPGLRTGVKVAVLDSTGKVLDHGAIFPNPPQNRVGEAGQKLLGWIKAHNIELIAIGNGTASRETERFVKALLKSYPELKAQPVIVNESGASIYSASEFASKELPDLDVTIRGAVSIARRLQDPLAELVKIDPQSIGVGQYQHDVSQTELARQLDAVVEDCVNSVGVDLNTASAALLERVAGLSKTLADNIVIFREQNGAFDSRASLKEVPRLGPKAFEQAAGFLRIANGSNALDRSGVHPEAYQVVHKMAAANDSHVESLLGNHALLRSIRATDFVDDRFGLPTITDILKELDKPGRDPRPEFTTAALQDGIETIGDLEVGMKLEGTVTNVTNFGAFVDIGVHQDGLVHISALADRFVSDPREVVKAGQIVSVTVMEVDAQRKRIALSMKSKPDTTGGQTSDNNRTKPQQHRPSKPTQSNAPANSAMAAALANAMKKR